MFRHCKHWLFFIYVKAVLIQSIHVMLCPIMITIMCSCYVLMIASYNDSTILMIYSRLYIVSFLYRNLIIGNITKIRDGIERGAFGEFLHL